MPVTRLDEDAAWALIREALARSASGASDATRTCRFSVPAATGVWLDADPSGRWQASVPPTPDARDMLDLFLPLTGAPDLVIGQLGQSLDGRIATEGGDSRYVTGRADVRRLHRLRALVDAVIVGAETVARDDPRLTVREVEGENPVRVVLDPDERVGRDRRIFADDDARTLVVSRARPDRGRTRKGGAPGGPPGAKASDRCEVVTLAVGPEGFDPAAVLDALRARGHRRVLVEGGGVTVSRFLQAGLLDRLHVTVAPLLIGSGRPAFTLPPIAALSEALRPRSRHFHLGEDVLFDLDLRSGG